MTTPAAIVALADGNLGNFIAATTPGGIEAQEAAGQKDFVASETIPIYDGHRPMREHTRAVLEGWGFVFGEPVDELFRSCKLPAGWRKEAADHSMHSDIVDSEGRKRIHIFYKAAFYDRGADFSVVRAAQARVDYDSEDSSRAWVMFKEKIVWESETRRAEDRKDLSEIRCALQDLAHEKLNELYPINNIVGKYWD